VRVHATRLGTALLLGTLACDVGRPDPPPEPITIFAAASLARPLQALTTAFQDETDVPALVELGGSIEQSRKLTDLGRTPDVLLLVDDEVIAALMPAHLDWYVRFATNRVVVAYTDRSAHADSISLDNWYRLLVRDDVRVGRADATLSPAGRHALALLQRAEGFYGLPHLSERVLERSTLKYVRPNAAELAVLLETGEVDYVLEYESVARQYGFRFLALPTELSLPILYGVSVPRQATHATAAVRFVASLLSDDGKQILRDAHVNVLRVPIALGTNVPTEITEVVRTLAAAGTAAAAAAP
jgi:molybdate/tungstate transport system substrate-binding protein